MKKKLLFIFYLVLAIIPLKVDAAAITSTSMSTVGEQTVGTYFDVTFKMSFSGVEKGSSDTSGVYMTAFELVFDDSILEITNISSPSWDSTVYKDGENYYILSIVDDSAENKCIDNFLACSTTYSATLKFYVKATDKQSTDLKVTQYAAGLFKVDPNVEEYLVENMEELEFNSNRVQTIKLKQATTEVKDSQKNIVIEESKPEIKNNTINPSTKSNSSKSSSNKQNTNSETNSQTDSTKSSNNYLKSLSIKDYEIEFKKDKFFYNITVPYNTNKLKINVETEDTKSSFKINGADNLKENNDTVKIVVTAEDGKQQTYNINIKRLEKNKSEFTDKDADKTVNKLTKIIFIIVAAIVIILILAGIVSYHNKRALKKLIDKME